MTQTSALAQQRQRVSESVRRAAACEGGQRRHQSEAGCCEWLGPMRLRRAAACDGGQRQVTIVTQASGMWRRGGWRRAAASDLDCGPASVAEWGGPWRVMDCAPLRVTWDGASEPGWPLRMTAGSARPVSDSSQTFKVSYTIWKSDTLGKSG